MTQLSAGQLDDVALTQPLLLLVDDERNILSVISQVVEALGYQLITASSGKEALDVYAAYKDEIELVIIDYMMPVMNGAELLAQLVKRDIGCPVYISSGFLPDGVEEKLSAKGASGFMHKPYGMVELKRMLDAHLLLCTD